MKKNTIYYRFSSEKKEFCINFDTTEILISDIKHEIEKRRNMKEKFPELYDLIIYDMDSKEEIKDPNTKIEPRKKLIIKRFPKYRSEPSFISIITDPSEILLSKGNEKNFNYTKSKFGIQSNNEPLYKIVNKISYEMLQDKFKCILCKRTETKDYEYKPIITLCCEITICEECYKDAKVCPNCNKPVEGYLPNNSEYELKKKLYEILEKNKEEINKQKINQMNQIKLDNRNSSGNTTIRPNISLIQRPRCLSTSFLSSPIFSVMEINTRFFIIKSSNRENIEISMTHSEWATTLTNQNKMIEAFKQGNVILIFSVNRTGYFQGFAIMTSFPSDRPSPNWHNENNVKLGGSFGVKWLCVCEMPFNKIKNMTNPLNGNEPLNKSRDTQELPKELGIDLCSLCFDQEKSDSSYKPSKNITKDMMDKIQDEIKNNKDKHNQNKQINNNIQNNNNRINNAQIPPTSTFNRNIINPYIGLPYMSVYGMMANPNINMTQTQSQVTTERTRSRSKNSVSKK